MSDISETVNDINGKYVTETVDQILAKVRIYSSANSKEGCTNPCSACDCDCVCVCDACDCDCDGGPAPAGKYSVR